MVVDDGFGQGVVRLAAWEIRESNAELLQSPLFRPLPSTDSTRRRTPVVTFQSLGGGTYRVIGGPHHNALTERTASANPLVQAFTTLHQDAAQPTDEPPLTFSFRQTEN